MDSMCTIGIDSKKEKSMLRAKNVLIMSSILASSHALGGTSRCGVIASLDINRNLRDAYLILKYVYKCDIPQTKVNPRSQRELDLTMADAERATNNGTFLPVGAGDLGVNSEQYEAMREQVYFPLFTKPGSNPLIWWKIPFTDFNSAEFQPIKELNCHPNYKPPIEFSQVDYCVAGCFAPDQSVLFFEEDQVNTYWKPIEAAYEKDRSVAAVAKGSSIGNVLYTPAAISYYLRDFAETTNAITHFFTKDGYDIKVTPNHPMVDGLGMVRRASSFKVGEDLVTYQGKPSAITSIQSEIHKGRVYNFDTEESEDHYKIIAANGLLSGTHWYQKLSRRMNQNAFQTIAHGSDFVEALESQGGL